MMRRRLGSIPGRRRGAIGAAALIAGGALAAAAIGRMRKLSKVDAGLRSIGLAFVPPMLPVLVPLMQAATRRVRTAPPTRVQVVEHRVPTGDTGRRTRVLALRRTSHQATGAAMVWLHGGGYMIGTPEIDMALLTRMLDAVDLTIFSVDYRLAPQHPYPAAFDDASGVLRWVVDNAAMLGVDPARIAVGGNSAGGGLAAALAQWACDQGIALALQLLMYPMLDDRTVCRADSGGRGELVWTPNDNRLGWTSYLGHAPGAGRTAAYAVPARREDVSGLAPAWIGVGGLDLFHDEDVTYAERLRAAGVPCALNVVSDAPHAFDLFNFDTPIARTFHDDMAAALAGGTATKR